MTEITPAIRQILEKQQYRIVGNHSAVKICSWTKKSIKEEGVCYKEQFYGIRCHMCCQMTPNLSCCNQCVFCWREMDKCTSLELNDDDDPKTIVDNAILGQRKLLTGLKGYDKTDMKKWEEAQEPMHFAISLAGEPTAYSRLKELIDEIHSRGKSTFVVTNGQYPEQLKKIIPTQLYLSVDAPNKELYEKIDKPLFKDFWERFNESLEILNSLNDKTRTALRITAVKEMNMVDEEGYASIIKKANPMFVEVKAYMFIGSSRMRLSLENMPRHEEVVDFSKKIANLSGYKIIDEKKESRVVLLMKEDSDDRVMKF